VHFLIGVRHARAVHKEEFPIIYLSR